MARMKRRWSPSERWEAQADLRRRMSEGAVSVGEAVRELRQRFAGLTLEEYARMIGISKTTLLKIEKDDPAVMRESIEKAIGPLGFKLTLVWKEPG